MITRENQQVVSRKSKKGCCISIVVLILVIALGVGAFLKFGKSFETIISFITKHDITTKNITLQNPLNIAGSIYFVKDRDLWKISDSHITQVTHLGTVDEAQVSSDGMKVVYTQLFDNYSELYLLDLTTYSNTKLLSGKSRSDLYSNLWYVDPTLSPDGTGIAMLSDKEKFYTGVDDLSVYTMDLKTSQVTDLTQGLPYTGGDQDPAYYPLDSHYLVYNKYVYTNGQAQPFSQLYLYNTNTKTGTPITPDFSGTLEPIFSPDGTYLAFTQRENSITQPGKYVDLYIMPFHITNLTATDAKQAFLNDYNAATLFYKGLTAMPVFSPDGKSIAFLYQENDNFNLATLNIATASNKTGEAVIQPTGFSAITTNSGITATSRLSWTN